MKDKTTAGVLALFLGGIGGHKFYLGQAGAGLIYLLFCWTCVPLFVAFFEAIGLLTMSQAVFDARFNGVAEPRSVIVHVASPPAYTAPGYGAPGYGAPGYGAPGRGELASQIKALHELKVAGAISEEEFTAQKQRLMMG